VNDVYGLAPRWFTQFVKIR